MNAAFAKFKDLADKKKNVSDEDIRAMLEEKLDRYAGSVSRSSTIEVSLRQQVDA